jgi:twitching motility protein PilJ
MKIESRNIFATMKENVFTTFLVLMAILCSVAMAVSIVIFLRNSARDQGYLQLVADLRVNIGQLTTQSRDASNGSEEGFTALQATSNQMETTWTQLRLSDTSTRSALAAQIAQYSAIWDRVKNNTQTIIASKDNAPPKTSCFLPRSVATNTSFRVKW